MSDRYEVIVKVISQKGTCVNEHKVGDQWVVSKKTPAGMCMSAYNAIYPNIRVLMFGGSLPWEKNPDMTTMACPDETNPVVFELRRGKKIS